MRVGIAVALLVASLAAVGCGGEGDEGGAATEASEHVTSPAKALDELKEVRTGLDQAIETYRSGDAARADEQVGDTYLQHFELVEGPLEEVDAELNERLEDSIREELREKIKADAPVSEVAELKREIDAGLDKAEAALR